MKLSAAHCPLKEPGTEYLRLSLPSHSNTNNYEYNTPFALSKYRTAHWNGNGKTRRDVTASDRT